LVSGRHAVFLDFLEDTPVSILRHVEFEWDRRKAGTNEGKHGVDFEEAAEVFADVLSSTVADPDHSLGESRFLIFGRSRGGRYLVVSFTDRSGKIRIISARRMTRREREAYER